MADIRSDFVGIRSPNPFWLASAPPTDKAYNVIRAFKAGWGGVVWKTLGEEGPPVVNVNGPRYGAIWGADRRLLGLNNIELITDRDLYVNLREIKQVKRDWPDRAMVVSIMVPCEEAAWKAILPLVEETGADGIELEVSLDPALAARVPGPTPVFIIARNAAGGPPLAVIRSSTTELPKSVRLTDANAMMEGVTFLDQDELELVARVSLSGSPAQRPGDLYGAVNYRRGNGGTARIRIDRIAE